MPVSRPPVAHPRFAEALPLALSATTGGKPGDVVAARGGGIALGRLRLVPAHDPKLRCALADAARLSRVGEVPLGDGRMLIPDLDAVFGRDDFLDDETVRVLLLARATLETDSGKRALAKAERRRLAALTARVRLMLTQAASWTWTALGDLAGQLELAAHFHALSRHAHSELAAVLARGLVPDSARFDLAALRNLARRHAPQWPIAEGWAARDAALDAVAWDFAPGEAARRSA
jgi:hypothetical protein